MTASGIFDNEASSVDLKIYDDLKTLGWSRESKTLLYQPKYDLSAEEQADFPGSKSIKPDFVLQDLQGIPLAVIENKLDDPNKALPKLRLKYSRVLRPRFLYACSANKILFYDLAWRGVDAGEFRPGRQRQGEPEGRTRRLSTVAKAKEMAAGAGLIVKARLPTLICAVSPMSTL